MGRGFPSRKNVRHKALEVQEGGGLQELREGTLGRVTKHKGVTGATSKGLRFILKGNREFLERFKHIWFSKVSLVAG